MAKQVEIGSSLGAERSADGKSHAGKRKVTFLENGTEFEAWAKVAAQEAAKYNLKFNPIDVVNRGYSLLHQGDMNRKLDGKFGKPDSKTAKVKDLSGAEAI